MRTGSILIVLTLLAAAMLVAAGCTTVPPTNQTTATTTAPAGTLTPAETMTPAENATANVTPTNTTAPNVTPMANITTPFVNGTWQWIARAGSESFQVSNPSRYTIAFSPNGTYAVQADCNTGSGNFTVNGTKMTIDAPVVTLKFCGDSSLDSEFLSALLEVSGYQMDSQGRLVMLLVNPTERIIFAKAK